MKKFCFIFILIICFILSLNTQDKKTDDTTKKSTNSGGEDVDYTEAKERISEIRLSGFEDASFWVTTMSNDQGIISKQSRIGAANDLVDDKAINYVKKRDEEFNIPQDYPKQKVLGVKVEFIARGYNLFCIKPVKPMVIEGRCMSIRFYVAGRNYKHQLKVCFVDYYGKEQIIPADRLNFIGWKEIVVPIPDKITQTDYHFATKIGIKFNGFIIECDPIEAYGIYYIYFDELRARTDLFNERIESRGYDISDDW